MKFEGVEGRNSKSTEISLMEIGVFMVTVRTDTDTDNTGKNDTGTVLVMTKFVKWHRYHTAKIQFIPMVLMVIPLRIFYERLIQKNSFFVFFFLIFVAFLSFIHLL